MEVELEHVAVGCGARSNAMSGRRYGCASLSKGGEEREVRAVFAAGVGVALVEKRGRQAPRVKRTLHHRLHESAEVTSVFLYEAMEGGEFVVAGDARGRVVLWEKGQDWELEVLSTVCEGEQRLPTASVSAVAMTETRGLWIAIATFSDGVVAGFYKAKTRDGWKVSTVNNGVRMIMEAVDVTVLVTSLPESNENLETVLIATGGVDHKVHLFELDVGEASLRPLVALSGHHDWVRCVAFQQPRYRSLPDALFSNVTLASGSQDQRIRLWNIRVNTPQPDEVEDDSLQYSAAYSSAYGRNLVYAVQFDALLLGHEDWVTSLQWAGFAEDTDDNRTTLISASMDNTVILWENQENRGGWSPSNVVGTAGGNGLLAVADISTGDGCVDLFTLSFSGQIERWRRSSAPDSLFCPAASINGHTNAVTDLSWSLSGGLLMSVSLDQTTRILARSETDWHEISRAQVHGYDLNCGSFIGRSNSQANNSDRIVSGADEKILRVFEAPNQVYKTAAALRPLDYEEANKNSSTDNHVGHAYLPELSLTNKTAATSDADGSKLAQDYAPLFDDDDDSSVKIPVGDGLHRKTLWPEKRKLYGHGNELLCVASNQSGTLLASACKSREEHFASIWLWSTSDWSATQEPLAGHKSSVVQLAFSPDEQYLLSVSKDRQICVYARQNDGKFALHDRQKVHRRIIWSCTWAPDSQMFAVGSRDQTFSIWTKHSSGASFSLVHTVTETAAVTAVAFAPCSFGSNFLAVGLESGVCKVYSVSIEGDVVQCIALGAVSLVLSPALSISRLAWSPLGVSTSGGPAGNETHSLTLAVGSSDNSVRIYTVSI